MQQSPSWDANSHSINKLPTIYGTRGFITVFTGPCHWSLREPYAFSSHSPTLLPQDSFLPRRCVTFSNKLFSFRWGVVSPSPNSETGGRPFVGCPRLLIRCIHSYPPHPEAASSIRSMPWWQRPITVLLLYPPPVSEVKNAWSYTSTPNTPLWCGVQLKS